MNRIYLRLWESDGFYNGYALILAGWRPSFHRFKFATWRDVVNTINSKVPS